MRQRILSLFTSLCLVFLLLIPVPATADEYQAPDTLDFVFDEASLLSAAEIEQLETKATTIYAAHRVGIYVITVPSFEDLGAPSVYDCATELFTSYGLGFGEDLDGVLLLLSMEDRDFAFISHGNYANTVFSDYIKSLIEEEFLDDFANDDWYGGFSDYFSECADSLDDYVNGVSETPDKDYYYDDNYYDDYYYDDYYNDSYYNDGRSPAVTWLIIIGVPVLIAFVVCSIFKSQMKTAVKKTEAHDYIIAKDIDIHVRQDIFTHRTETRRVIQSSSGSSGGHHSSGGGSRSGGGFSGRSGKF